jgi:hypothetical protein
MAAEAADAVNASTVQTDIAAATPAEAIHLLMARPRYFVLASYVEVLMV